MTGPLMNNPYIANTTEIGLGAPIRLEIPPLGDDERKVCPLWCFG